MIYLAVRLARNSTTTASGSSNPGELDQFWLHASAESDEGDQTRIPDEAFDEGRVQWFRSPRIAYVLREPWER